MNLQTPIREKEAKNALNAYKFIEEWSYNNPGTEITETVIRQIHTEITRDLNYLSNEPGQYRNTVVTFGNPRKVSTLKDRFGVEVAMEQLARFINSKETSISDLSHSPTTKAIFTHYLLTLIHPFADGNGRVARAVEALILHHYGKFDSFLFSVNAKSYYHKRKEYFRLLKETDESGNPEAFIVFATNCLHVSLNEIKKRILEKTTHLMIMDYAHQLRRKKTLLKRQVTLLDIMFRLRPMTVIEWNQNPSIMGIYNGLSDSTRARDIRKLALIGFLKYEPPKPKGRGLLTGLIHDKLISVNWDILKDITLRLDRVPRRPNI